MILSIRRFLRFLWLFESRRPHALLLFAAVGSSLAEKGAMAWYARARGVPALLFPRGGGVIDACRAARFTRSWVRLAFRGARKVLCQGPAWHRFAVETLGFDQADAPIISNWTATPELLSIGYSRRHDPSRKPVRMLFVGWVDREKGVLDLLEACIELPQGSFTLEIVGEGNASTEARRFVELHRLSHTIAFRGWLTGDDLQHAYAASDVFILPSWTEGLPNAMIEAMAARLAVIVSAVGNVPDVVTHGREALLVPPKDVSQLRREIGHLLCDPSLRAHIADGGFEMARSKFAVERAAEALEYEIRQVRVA